MSKFTLQLLETGDVLVVGAGGHGDSMVWVGAIAEEHLPEIKRRFFL